ncbi:hypothetical protein VE03_02000 [Pseudogymnoascus sp. 23342-1-I1]|nr:hypothetical protein VE03_02000 [Pseudogymnoascus sp. 23342-1-I1]
MAFGGPFSQVHNPGQSLVKAQRALEESFENLHATWKESVEYYEGASVGDDAVQQAVAVALNEPLTSADSYSKVIAKALLKDNAQQDTISGRTKVCMSKVFPVLSVVLGVVSFSADAAGLLPLKITANALSQVVTLASDEHSSSVAVIEGLEELSDHQQFLNSFSSLNFELDNGTDSILVKATNLLVAITDFLRISIQFLQKHFARRVWDKVTTDDVNAAMKSLQNARQNFDRVVHGAAAAIVLRRDNEEVTRKALDNMSPLTFKKTHDDVVRNRLDKSGKWLLEHPKFDKWLHGDILTLWCPGEAGAGKTVLTSIVVDHVDSYLKSERETQPDKRVGLVYLYCRFQNEAEQTVLQFVPAIIRQLSAQDLSTVGRVKKFNEEHPRNPATLTEYTTLLAEVLDSFSAVYLVVDALDEFSKSEYERKLLAQELLSLNCTRTTVRIFITSRPDRDIAKELGGEKVDIEASDTDIRAYIERVIETNSVLKSWVRRRPELRPKMLETIPNKARKIFQLAKMQIDHLIIEETVEDVMDALDSLSSNVNDYYQKSIERIESMSSTRDQNIIKIILKWVYYAKAPLKVDEIYHILAVKPGNKSAVRLQRNVESNKELGLETFIDRSAGLLTIREESQIVSVAHPTVQEYLKTLEATLLSNAEEEISERCLTYLFLDEFANGPCLSGESLDYRLSEFALVKYASSYWCDHLRGKPEDNATLQNLALDFLKNRQALWSSVQIALDRRYLRPLKTVAEEIPGVIVAAMFGLAPIVNRLVVDGGGVEKMGDVLEGALDEAIGSGHEPVIKFLMDIGVKVDYDHGRDITDALQSAASRGYDDTVKLLLKNGADVSARGQLDYYSALHRASASGHIQVVRTLLNAGAQVEACDGEDSGPLQIASIGGHTAVVRVLLDNGANINAQCTRYGNALCAASDAGSVEIVKLLLQNKAPKVEVNVEGGYTYGALHKSSEKGHETIARLLVENGADVNADHALEAASYKGHMAIVKLLLQNGADVNAQGGENNNALQAAARGGHEAIVTLLLEKGADVNAQGLEAYLAGNALQAACYYGHEKVVQLLLKNGAEVNAPREIYRDNYKYMFALQTAVAEGHVAVARLLLEEGADVNAGSKRQYNALWAAVNKGHEGMVKLLLEWGAAVNWDKEHWRKLRAGECGQIDDAIIELLDSHPRVRGVVAELVGLDAACRFELP